MKAPESGAFSLAVAVGFEPTVVLPTHDFEFCPSTSTRVHPVVFTGFSRDARTRNTPPDGPE
jgi:hypothetical protein